MSSRQSKRPGFGILRGASNPPITISFTSPKNPSDYHIWIDMTDNKMYYFLGSSWIQVVS
jgi:hypothetical protein